MSDQAYRAILSEIGVCDDRIERALTHILRDKDTALQLERDRVPDKVWVLEQQLLKERTA